MLAAHIQQLLRLPELICLPLIAPVYAPSSKGEISCAPSFIGSSRSAINAFITGRQTNDGQIIISLFDKSWSLKLDIAESQSLASDSVLFDFQLAAIKIFFRYSM